MSDTKDKPMEQKTPNDFLKEKFPRLRAMLDRAGYELKEMMWIAMNQYANTIHAREMAKKDEEIERLRGLLVKYRNHVDDEEGSDFLEIWFDTDSTYLTKEEKKYIANLKSDS